MIHEMFTVELEPDLRNCRREPTMTFGIIGRIRANVPCAVFGGCADIFGNEKRLLLGRIPIDASAHIREGGALGFELPVRIDAAILRALDRSRSASDGSLVLEAKMQVITGTPIDVKWISLRVERDRWLAVMHELGFDEVVVFGTRSRLLQRL